MPRDAIQARLLLDLAHADMHIAGQRADDDTPLVRGLRCYHCQQAAEKALKSVYAWQGIEYEKIHNIARLLNDLPSTINVPTELASAAGLNVYIMDTRYPDDLVDATHDDLEEAIQLANSVVTWAEQEITPGRTAP